MKRFLSILSLLLGINGYGQNPNASDTHEVFKNLPNDTSRISSLISSARKIENTNPRKAVEYSREAVQLSLQLHYVRGLSQSLNCLGRDFLLSGNPDSSLFYFRQSLSSAISENNNHSISTAIMNIGTVFKNRGIYDSASIYYHRALSIAEKNNDFEIMTNCLNNLGIVLKEQDNANEAIGYYLQALALGEKRKDEKETANANLNLGTCYDLLGEYTISEKYFKDALKIFTFLNDDASVAKCNNNMGTSLKAQGKFNEAFPFYYKALNIKEKLGNKNSIASTLYSLAALNDSIKKYDEALNLSERSLHLSIEMGNKKSELDNYELLQELSFKQQNYKQAYDYLDRATVLRDSVFNENKTRIIDELQTKYETEKKEQQIKILNVENKTRSLQRNILFTGSIALLITITGLIFIFSQQRRISRQRIQIQDKRISELLQEQTINAYNAMIIGQEQERKRIAVDLHDRLGSMLSTVKVYFSAFRAKKKLDDLETIQLEEKATSLLDLTFDELRKIANDLSTGTITDLGLRPAIEDLCETISNGSSIKTKVLFYNLTERIDNQTEIGIYRIIQELLSNILKHAQAKNIIVQLNKIDDTLQVTIEDDGVGYNYNEKMKSPGMGLKNILTRVEKLGGKFHVESEAHKGTFSFLEIPIRTEVLNPIHPN